MLGYCLNNRDLAYILKYYSVEHRVNLNTLKLALSEYPYLGGVYCFTYPSDLTVIHVPSLGKWFFYAKDLVLHICSMKIKRVK